MSLSTWKPLAGITGDWTWDLLCAKEIYHWATAPTLNIQSYFILNSSRSVLSTEIHIGSSRPQVKGVFHFTIHLTTFNWKCQGIESEIFLHAKYVLFSWVTALPKLWAFFLTIGRIRKRQRRKAAKRKDPWKSHPPRNELFMKKGCIVKWKESHGISYKEPLAISYYVSSLQDLGWTPRQSEWLAFSGILCQN